MIITHTFKSLPKHFFLFIVQEGWSTAAKIFIRLLTHESFDQLCFVFDEYRLISGLSIEEAIKSTFSGDLETAALCIGK
jgi:hypothetical protein